MRAIAWELCFIVGRFNDSFRIDFTCVQKIIRITRSKSVWQLEKLDSRFLWRIFGIACKTGRRSAVCSSLGRRIGRKRCVTCNVSPHTVESECYYCYYCNLFLLLSSRERFWLWKILYFC